MMKISERFDLILSGRKPFSLMSDFHVPKNTIEALLEDRLPKADALTRLGVAERLRLDWLIHEDGVPFAVFRAIDQDEALQTIREVIDYNSGADVYLVDGDKQSACILSMGVTKQYPGEEAFEYTDIRVFSGLSKSTSRLIKPIKGLLYSLPMSEKEFDDLVGGWMGNQRILDLQDRAESLQPPENTAEAVAPYDVAQGLQQLVAIYNKMPPARQRDLLSIARALEANPPG